MCAAQAMRSLHLPVEKSIASSQKIHSVATSLMVKSVQMVNVGCRATGPVLNMYAVPVEMFWSYLLFALALARSFSVQECPMETPVWIVANAPLASVILDQGPQGLVGVRNKRQEVVQYAG